MAFECKKKISTREKEAKQKMDALENKLTRKNEVLSELMEECYRASVDRTQRTFAP